MTAPTNIPLGEGGAISLKTLAEYCFPGNPSVEKLTDQPLNGITCDSREIKPGMLFIAVRGIKADGTEFIREAVEKGAVAIVGEDLGPTPSHVPFIQVSNSRSAAGRLASAFYRHPSRKMKVAGITGTNGKTTSAYLLEHFLTLGGRKVGVIGTINYRYPGKEIPAVETTPGPLKLQAILNEMAEAGCGYAAMEVSSHALDQRRVEGIEFEAALFTNLTQDHLDYHGTLEAYFESKSALFLKLADDKTAVLNADDEWNRKLFGKIRCSILTYSIDSPSDFRALNLQMGSEGSRFDLEYRGLRVPVISPLVGRHNVYNALGSIALYKSIGGDWEKAAARLSSFRGVPGRLERVEGGQNFSVFIDFAHTPDGLENVLKSLRAFKNKRLITLFGCGGDRDRTKRPKMAAIAAQFSDLVIVTSDNPRSEDPRLIAQEVCGGFGDFKNFSVTLDRKKAIRQALLAAGEGDIVLLAGKGHERVQITAGQSLPFSDREEAEKVLSLR